MNTEYTTSLQETADVKTTVVPHPVLRAERIGTVDIIRGVAILGILLMNIPSFGGHWTMMFDALKSPHNNVDYLTVMTIFTFFEGTMRGLFSMLFGAGMLLFIMNKKDQPGGATVTEYYYRRLVWLVGFGLLHAYVFQWSGEILFFYGLMGMILYSRRYSSGRSNRPDRQWEIPRNSLGGGKISLKIRLDSFMLITRPDKFQDIPTVRSTRTGPILRQLPKLKTTAGLTGGPGAYGIGMRSTLGLFWLPYTP